MYKFQSKVELENFLLTDHIPKLKRNFKPNDLEKLEDSARYVQRDLQNLRTDMENPSIDDKKKKRYKNKTIRRIQLDMWDNVKTVAFRIDLITKDAIETDVPTCEHWYSGDRLATEFEAMVTIPTCEYIVNEMKTKLTWIYTTKEENQILKNNDQNYSDPRISTLVDWVKK